VATEYYSLQGVCKEWHCAYERICIHIFDPYTCTILGTDNGSSELVPHANVKTWPLQLLEIELAKKSHVTVTDSGSSAVSFFARHTAQKQKAHQDDSDTGSSGKQAIQPFPHLINYICDLKRYRVKLIHLSTSLRIKSRFPRHGCSTKYSEVCTYSCTTGVEYLSCVSRRSTLAN
jgi:hypothetical protein